MRHIEVYLRNWSEYPGGRYRSAGPYSAEEYRDDVLIPILDIAITEGRTIILDLDGVVGYASSFLDECFGGLVKKYNFETIRSHFKFVCTDEPDIVSDIDRYMLEAAD